MSSYLTLVCHEDTWTLVATEAFGRWKPCWIASTHDQNDTRGPNIAWVGSGRHILDVVGNGGSDQQSYCRRSTLMASAAPTGSSVFDCGSRPILAPHPRHQYRTRPNRRNPSH